MLGCFNWCPEEKSNKIIKTITCKKVREKIPSCFIKVFLNNALTFFQEFYYPVNSFIQVKKDAVKMDKGMVLDHNDIDGLIAAYDGDAKALIAALLDERKLLIHEIEVATSAMSVGYGRRWKPSLPVEE